MSDPLIISVSGLRGLVGKTLTPDVITRYTTAFYRYLKQRNPDKKDMPVLIGRDGRPGGDQISLLLHDTLNTLGCNTIDLGILPTPTVGIMVTHLKAAGAIQITASHNPLPWNGLKLFNPDGRVLPATEGEIVKGFYEEHFNLPTRTDTPRGKMNFCHDTLSAHTQRVLNCVDVDLIKKRHFSVLLDANHGSGSILGKYFLEQLGCKVTHASEWYTETSGTEIPDGLFPHTPEPTAENLAPLCEKLHADKSFHLDVGFCMDPDADRLAVLDETGSYIGEEYTVAMCAEHLLRKLARNKDHLNSECLVTNCSSSRMTQDAAEKYGAAFFTSKVGEANVVDCILEHHALFGGEGNGGPIYPKVGLVRDTLVGMALILEMLAGENKTLSSLVFQMPHYEIVKVKIPFYGGNMQDLYSQLILHFPDAVTDTRDGLRLSWCDRWLLVRPSNTEPIIRAIAEAPSAEEALKLTHVARTLIKQNNE